MNDIVAVGHGFTEVPPKFFTFNMEIPKLHKKACYKYEIANMCGVSMSSFCYWINHLYIEKLKTTGYNKNQKILTWPQISLLNSLLDFLE